MVSGKSRKRAKAGKPRQAKAKQPSLKKQIDEVIRSMDYVVATLDAERLPKKEAELYAQIYQQLGLAWEHLALQCTHREGYRRARDGNFSCRVCGKIRGVDDTHVLLPTAGRKKLGRRRVPKSQKVYPNRKAAVVTDDAIDFHGARLKVDVFNSYESRLLGDKEITIAAERIVTLEEGDVEFSIGQYRIDLDLRPKKERSGNLPYSAFPNELPKKKLESFPILLNHDESGRFTGITILGGTDIARKRR